MAPGEQWLSFLSKAAAQCSMPYFLGQFNDDSGSQKNQKSVGKLSTPQPCVRRRTGREGLRGIFGVVLFAAIITPSFHRREHHHA
jgi:hypothetical protein